MNQKPRSPFALVVNTSIVRAAGTRDHPTSRNCRKTLDAIRQFGFRIAMCDELEGEWIRRRDQEQGSTGPSETWPFYVSRYSMEWYTQMRRKRQVHWIPLPQHSPVRSRAEAWAQRLWPGIRQVEKDLFLIELALASDRRIISLNEKQREQFSQLAKHIPELADILWLNPDREDVPAWLQRGAPDDPQYRLDP